MTPRTKHIALKYHWFKSKVSSGIMTIRRCKTADQLADIFTKPVPKPVLVKLRREIMGWQAMFK